MKSNRRYYLHRRAKSAGFRVNARARTVFIPPSGAENKYINELIHKFKYINQLELL